MGNRIVTFILGVLIGLSNNGVGRDRGGRRGGFSIGVHHRGEMGRTGTLVFLSVTSLFLIWFFYMAFTSP